MEIVMFMKRGAAGALFLLALSTSQAHAGEASRNTSSASWAEAVANRENMATPPKFVEGPYATLTESEKALGHHGPVVVEGIIDVDGRMREPRIKVSSRAEAVDAIALDAAGASTFSPAMDAAGAALAVVVAMPFDLVSYKSRSGGMFEYRCDQFVRDMDWWKRAHPEEAYKKHELYTMQLGFFMSGLVLRSGKEQELFRAEIERFDERWLAAIETCRKKPKLLQKDVIFRQ